MATVRLFVVPHTHYDAEVFLARDETLALGSDNLLDVLHLLDHDPAYRFVLDQRAYLEGFATLYPEQFVRLKEHVSSGRLQVAGGMHTMPDVNLPGGESLVRQILYGRAYIDEVLGARDTVGWMLDCFGHHPQVPQLMCKAGFDSYVFHRGVAGGERAAFWWVGLDGSRLRCEWLPTAMYAVPPTLPEFRELVEGLMRALEPYLYNGQGLVLNVVDLGAPAPHLPDLIRRYNAEGHEVELVLASAREYFAAQPADGLEEWAGDLNPLFTGCYAARIAMKQHNRALENALLSAEKVSAVNWAEQRLAPASLEAAWEPVLFNQFHDLICGSHLDVPNERAMERYKLAAKRTAQVVEQALDALTARIDTRGEGLALVVFNLLGFERLDVARCRVALGPGAWESLALYDADGIRIPLQMEDVQRYPDGSIKRADLLFLARVGPLGYRTYFVRQGEGASPSTDLWVWRHSMPDPWPDAFFPDDGRMGNSQVEVHANPRTAAITALVLRELGWDAVDARGDHAFGAVCRQEDRGDPWEYYGPLRGGTLTTLPLVDPVPARGQAVFSDEFGGEGRSRGGPVMAELLVTGPFGAGTRDLRIRLYAGLSRVEIETSLTNQQRFVRYRNVFPLNLKQPRIVYEIPFGALERPEGEYPAQNWVDVSDGERSLALLNRGIPGHSLVGSMLTSSLMKCTRVVSYEGGGYSREAKDSAGFEIGVPHRFEQALLPHRGTWQQARLVQEGLAYNVPLQVRKVLGHGGPLPTAESFMQVAPETVVLHALYIEQDRLILRLAEAAGSDAEGRVSLRWPIGTVEETNLVGAEARRVQASGRSFSFSASPFEVKTFRVQLA